MAQKLSQDAEKLAQSRALNAELVQKIQELQKLLQQIKDQYAPPRHAARPGSAEADVAPGNRARACRT